MSTAIARCLRARSSGHHAVERRVDCDHVEVDEGNADLVGDGGDEVLLADEVLRQEELGQGDAVLRLPFEQPLEGVARQDLAVDEELTQTARGSLHPVQYRPSGAQS